MIPKDGDLFQVWFKNTEDKVVFEGWVLGKDEVEDTPKRVFRIYAFVDDPKKIMKELTDKHGPLTTSYGVIPYTGLFVCQTCNASYSTEEHLDEHKRDLHA